MVQTQSLMQGRRMLRAFLCCVASDSLAQPAYHLILLSPALHVRSLPAVVTVTRHTILSVDFLESFAPQVELDCDAQTIGFYVNGKFQVSNSVKTLHHSDCRLI